jgi:SIR2-like domain
MALDPIVSLTIAVAESPGSYAFLLGSGVSRDAGVPTGMEVFWQTVGALYRLENETEETPEHEQLADWLIQTGRAGLNYSGILELLAPAQEDRRAYLAGFFEGREPGEAHRRLADLAARRLIRVFITTNFDRLLEHALQEVGLEPVVVTSDADLSRAPAREHVPCYVLKPHGDYLQQTIRNTVAELAELERGVAGELRSIIDRSGLVVIGYSGSDEAIAEAIRARSSRYSLYWVSRGELGEPGRSLVETNAGLTIIRPDAASFLADLDRRLAVYAAHPSGETPELLNAEVISLLRVGDDIGLRELLKVQRRALEHEAEPAILDRQNQNTYDALAEFAELMTPLLERYLAVSFPLIEHDSPAMG